jgi:hypothetical protein
VRLSELFAPGKNSLVIYSMMFPSAADDTNPWPAGRANRVAALGGGSVPVVHRPARSTGRRGRSGAAASQMITGTTQTMWWVQVTGDTT